MGTALFDDSFQPKDLNVCEGIALYPVISDSLTAKVWRHAYDSLQKYARSNRVLGNLDCHKNEIKTRSSIGEITFHRYCHEQSEQGFIRINYEFQGKTEYVIATITLSNGLLSIHSDLLGIAVHRISLNNERMVKHNINLLGTRLSRYNHVSRSVLQ